MGSTTPLNCPYLATEEVEGKKILVKEGKLDQHTICEQNPAR
jgi:hypothetical protein